jgi:hypothetical protein
VKPAAPGDSMRGWAHRMSQSARYLPCWMRFASLAAVRLAFLAEETWHSHTMNTRHPSLRKRDTFRRSLATFVENLSFQYCVLLFGVVAMAQPGCRCQKQPLTKMSALYLGSTTSGVPARSRRCREYLKPRACKCRRNNSSGNVSRPGMRDIRSDRCLGVRKSATNFAKGLSN